MAPWPPRVGEPPAKEVAPAVVDDGVGNPWADGLLFALDKAVVEGVLLPQLNQSGAVGIPKPLLQPVSAESATQQQKNPISD